MTPDMGRGIFATENIKKNEMIIVDKAIIGISDDPDVASKYIMTHNIYRQYKLKGQVAKRLMYLYAGDYTKVEIPDIKIYMENTY